MPNLIVEILGEASQFAAELDHAAGKTKSFGAVAGVAGLALAGGLAVGIEKSVHAAIEGQASQAALDQALRNTHQSLQATSGALEEAETASRKLGFTDDDTRSSLAKLEVATGDTGKSIKDLGLAEDLARFKHISLDAATKVLTGTLAGSSRAAKQLGISISPVTTHMDALKAKFKELKESIPPAEAAQAKFLDKQATAKNTLEAVTQKVHGQAQAFSGTAAGGMAQFGAQTQHIEETLGTLLLPALTKVSGALASFASFLAQHTTIVKVFVAAVGAVAATLVAVSVVSKVVAATQAIAAAATGAWTAAQWLLNAALDANPIGIVVVAIAALVAGLVIAYEKSATFRAIVTGALEAVSGAAKAVLGFFESNWKLIATLISGPFLPIVALATNMFGIRSAIVGAAQAVIGFFSSNWKTIAVLVSGPFAPLVALATNAFGVRSPLVNAFNAVLAAVKSVMGSVESAVRGAFNGAVAAIGGTVGAALAAATSVGSSIVHGVENGITGLVTGVESKINAVMAVVRGIPGRIVAALGDVSHLLYNAGAAIIGGLVDGLKSRLHEVTDLAGSIAGKIAGLKGPIEYDKVLLVPHGEAIMEGLLAGMQAGLAGVLKTASGIAPSIAATTGGGLRSAPGGGYSGHNMPGGSHGGPVGRERAVTVNQYFTQQPDDPYAYGARAKFALNGIFG